MQTVLLVLQVIAAILLAGSILIQERGSGMGEAIGGSSAAGFQTSKRGAEKVLAQLTVVLLVAFMILSLVLNFV
jgi:protein translocase SecG subunit